MNKILKLTVILFLICAVVAGVLGVINEVTYERIETREKEETKAAYGVVLPAEDYEEVSLSAELKAKYPTVDKISRGTKGEGYVVESTFSGAQGSITMAVGVGNDLKCTGISIIKHSETSGLGANAASTAEVGVNFRSQFVGQGADIALTKAGGSIDALSGATITSRSVTAATANSIALVTELSEG